MEHTGGTIDKLNSIPGFNTDLEPGKFLGVLKVVGCAIVSPGKDMVPADRKMYALRDVTGTVISLSLQTASIMSKKIAENPDSLVLDVKFGGGCIPEGHSLRNRACPKHDRDGREVWQNNNSFCDPDRTIS